MKSAADIIDRLELIRHPEGGWYRQMFCDTASDNNRAASTAIYYLLETGDRSHWHRVDAAEGWHFYLGAPLALSVSADGVRVEKHVLGTDFAANQSPQIVVPTGHWQSAVSLGDWTLTGCTVAPGFEFAGFEMAPKDWSPEQANA